MPQFAYNAFVIPFQLMRVLVMRCRLILIVLAFACQSIAWAQSSSEIADQFYQELDVQRAPTFNISGLPIKQEIHYQILSYFTLYQPNAAGDRKVVQEIRETRLLRADALSQSVFAGALDDLKGDKFEFVLDREGRVTKFSGGQQPAQVNQAQGANLKMVMVSKVMDDDGWKELARFTLFQPPKSERLKNNFSMTTRHDWGDLGSWYGETKVQRGSSKGALVQYDMRHDLEYVKPGKGNAGGLPFEIVDAEFKTTLAEAELMYDSRGQRMRQATERFVASGSIVAKMLGSQVKIGVEEKQQMTILIKSAKFRTRK